MSVTVSMVFLVWFMVFMVFMMTMIMVPVVMVMVVVVRPVLVGHGFFHDLIRRLKGFDRHLQYTTKN